MFEFLNKFFDKKAEQEREVKQAKDRLKESLSENNNAAARQIARMYIDHLEAALKENGETLVREANMLILNADDEVFGCKVVVTVVKR